MVRLLTNVMSISRYAINVIILMGLGLAIFFNAFVIRMLLVPAIMRVFNRQNWWAPKLLTAREGCII